MKEYKVTKNFKIFTDSCPQDRAGNPGKHCMK